MNNKTINSIYISLLVLIAVICFILLINKYKNQNENLNENNNENTVIIQEEDTDNENIKSEKTNDGNIENNDSNDIWNEVEEIDLKAEDNEVIKLFDRLNDTIKNAEVEREEDAIWIKGEELLIEFILENETYNVYLVEEEKKLNFETLRKYLNIEEFIELKDNIFKRLN